MRAEEQRRGDFAKLRACVESADIGDERETQLVILGPEHPHSTKMADSPARKAASEILNNRGTSPRIFKNAMLFLAADRARLDDLKKAIRSYLAWKSINGEASTLNLDPHQARTAKEKHDEFDGIVDQRLPETFQWLFVPGETKPGDGSAQIEWNEIRLSGGDGLATRASARLKRDGLMITTWAGTLLRIELDRVPLWRGNHVALRQLAEDFAKYLYLPKLKDGEVLLEAVRDGVKLLSWTQDSFAYADGWDEVKQRYRGLQVGRLVNIAVEGNGFLVKPEVAKAQLDAESTSAEPGTGAGAGAGGTSGSGGVEVVPGAPVSERPAAKVLTRFHGAAPLNPIRLSRDAGAIADEVVQHLTKLVGAKVEITLEIQAEIPEGAPDHVVRTITENCRTLKFRIFGFEED